MVIRLDQKENTGEIIIQDNGIGIMPANQPGLFDLKEKKITLGTAKEKGTGLGLVLVKEMVRLCEGQLSLVSVPGEGTTVAISLPLFR